MFAPVRIVATIILLASMGLVFVGAFVLGNAVRIPDLPAKEDVLGLMLFPGVVYRYVTDLFVGLPRILIYSTIVFVIIEYLAYTWYILLFDLRNNISDKPPPFRYCLSYIPYARAAVTKMIGFG